MILKFIKNFLINGYIEAWSFIYGAMKRIKKNGCRTLSGDPRTRWLNIAETRFARKKLACTAFGNAPVCTASDVRSCVEHWNPQ